MRNGRFILVPNASVFDHGRQVNDYVYLSARSLTNKHLLPLYSQIVVKGDRPSTDPARG